MSRIRLGLAQINATVGDLAGNVGKILDNIEEARRQAVDLLIFPELAVTGYPPEDLLLKPGFLKDNLDAVSKVVRSSEGLTVCVGFVDQQDDIYNAAAICHDGKLVGIYHKQYLPNYGVFDENRYFQQGEGEKIFTLGDLTFGVSICEDIWYPGGPAHRQALLGNAELIVNLSASPYHYGKIQSRERMLRTRAEDNATLLAYVNLVGGQDELIFDGTSVVIDATGEILARASSFEEKLLVVDVQGANVFRRRLHDPRRRKDKRHFGKEQHYRPVELKLLRESCQDPAPVAAECQKWLEPLPELYRALVTGLRDYVLKNGFRKVVIGLSGGVDSALTAVLAADALGPENVTAVYMPSRYSAEISENDARELAKKLGLPYLELSIEPTFKAFRSTLAEVFAGTGTDVTEENLQARIRATLLMALSNKFGWMVVTTGNKSEMSVGYCTLYGDMVGGFAAIKDVPKKLVYALCHYRNSWDSHPVIPERILTRPPSAELAPNQQDTDSLPPYELLDPILKAYVEEDRPIEYIVELGYPRELVQKIIRMVDRNEYKRRQGLPGCRITPRAFGKDRRMPITYRRSKVEPRTSNCCDLS